MSDIPRGGASARDASQVHAFLLGDFSSSPFVASARALVPVLRERARDQWAQDRILDETVADMQAAGFFQMLQPKAFGGHETSPIESFEVAATLAEADASVAWVLGVVGIHAFHLAMYDEKAQAEVWGENTQTLIGSPYAPRTARRVDGGYLLSGRWSFSSGSDHCDWTFLGANIEGEPSPPPGPVGTHVLLLPRSDYSIEHNWNVSGLRATGSNDIVVEDAFVPEHRALRWQDVLTRQAPGLALNDGLLFQLPFFQIFSRATQAPTALGSLKGMADSLVEFSRARRRNPKDPALTLALAQAYNFVDEAKGRLYANYAALINEAEGGAPVSALDQEKFRFQSALIPSRAAQLATELFRVAGGTGIYDDVPFGRYLADLNATQTHALNNYPARALDWMTPVLDTTGEVQRLPWEASR